jgi:hypothetical protein
MGHVEPLVTSNRAVVIVCTASKRPATPGPVDGEQ